MDAGPGSCAGSMARDAAREKVSKEACHDADSGGAAFERLHFKRDKQQTIPAASRLPSLPGTTTGERLGPADPFFTPTQPRAPLCSPLRLGHGRAARLMQAPAQQLSTSKHALSRRVALCPYSSCSIACCLDVLESAVMARKCIAHVLNLRNGAHRGAERAHWLGEWPLRSTFK